jgi:hypothetical protein
MWKRAYDRAKGADSAISLAGWAYKGLELLFPVAVATLVTWAASYRDWIWNTYGMLGALGAGLLAALAASLAVFLSGLGVRAWRASAADVPGLGMADITSTRTETASLPQTTKDGMHNRSKYLKDRVVYGGSRNPYQRPWFSAKFARRGKVARIYLDHSHHVGNWGVGWSNRTRIFLAEVVNFVPDQGIRIDLLSEYRRGDAKLWRWGCEETEPPNGDYAFIEQSSYRGRVLIICDDAPEERCYFVVIQPTHGSNVEVPIVVGHGTFNFIQEWEAEGDRQLE